MTTLSRGDIIKLYIIAHPRRFAMKTRKKISNILLPLLCLILLGTVAVLIARWATPQDPPADGSDWLQGITASTEDTKSTETDSEFSTGSTTELLTDDASESGTVSTESLSETDTSSEATEDSAPKDTDTTPSDPPPVTIVIPPPTDGSPKKIAFTFDDGPHWEYTRLIAEEFQKYGGKCTFFVVGNRVHGAQAEAMAYVAELGNEVGIHGYTHTVYFDYCNENSYQYEMETTAQKIQEITGKTPYLLRPPGGQMSNRRISACPYSVILWNVDPRDWAYKAVSQNNINTIVNNVLSASNDGDIVLLHDIYQNTYEAIKLLLPILHEQGYEFVTVSELLGEYREPGTLYRYAY